MNGSYANTVINRKFKEFNPDQHRFCGECQLKEVIFRMNLSKEEETDDLYVEWMLPCRTEPPDSKVPIVYFVSRAYHSHHVIVYSYDLLSGGWFIYNILANISVIIEEENQTAHDEEYAPHFVDLLKDYSDDRSLES